MSRGAKAFREVADVDLTDPELGPSWLEGRTAKDDPAESTIARDSSVRIFVRAKLSVRELAVFLLRELVGYSVDDVVVILGGRQSRQARYNSVINTTARARAKMAAARKSLGMEGGLV